MAADPISDIENNDPLISGFGNFVSWFRSHDGTVDDRVTIGYEPDTNIRGMIATAPIPAGTLLMRTPASLILSSPKRDQQCEVVGGIIKEMEAGTQSKWHTYFEFDDSSGQQRIPSQWDRSNGQGRAMDELQGLPPAGDTHRHLDWYQSACKNGEEMTDLDWKALLSFLTRAADLGLVPMYDLMNHHNGRINTKLEVDKEGALSVIALVDIPAEAPIFNTYARSGWESTVDVFNTYGFVEDYPQLWRWNDDNLTELTQANKDHANQRYGMSNSDSNDNPSDRLQFEPNTHHHEVLVLSPKLAALLPTKDLVSPLGNEQRSLADWKERIDAHHANLRASHANALADSAMAILDGLPSTIEDDERIVTDEKHRSLLTRSGGVDVNRIDTIKAIEFRLAFKKALRTTKDVSVSETFLDDIEEL